ncbi:hypothetical protein JX266_008918 [Neoarthrinium moseri]|nr:hypothetical protein JX266_008918 [Neoarthrinium moseri]
MVRTSQHSMPRSAAGSSTSSSTTTALTPSTRSASSRLFMTNVPAANNGDVSLYQGVTTPNSTGRGSTSSGATSDFGRLRLTPSSSTITTNLVTNSLGDLLIQSSGRPSLSSSTTQAGGQSLTPPAVPRRRSSSRTKQPPHAVEDEEPPDDRFHAPGFQQAYIEAIELVASLKAVLGSSTLHVDEDSTIGRLYQKATELSEFRCLARRTVGFVGDSGAGKSSLLNSLLDSQSLARTSGGGAACTCVATEYHYNVNDNYIVEVDWYNAVELHGLLMDMLQAYRHYYANGDDMAGEEKQDFAQRSKIADDTFQALFPGRWEDGNPSLTTGSTESAFNTLQSWILELGITNDAQRIIMDTLGECSDYLVNLTSDPSSAGVSAYWPRIKRIRVFVKAHILRNGLVLVDLPGLRDMNSARRNLTERYIIECDEIFVVANIDRATTNVGVKHVVALAKRAGLSNVGIICTKSDIIKAEEAIKDWPGEIANNIRKLSTMVNNAEKELRKVQEECNDYTDDELCEEDLVRAGELGRKQSQLTKLVNRQKFRLSKYLMETRNQKTSQSLLDLYQNEVPDGQLRIFCVSNDNYWQNRDLPADEFAKFLELSGIMALRRHCISIVSESQFRGASKFMKHDISALISDVELWAQAGAPSLDAERKQVICEALDIIDGRLRRDLIGTSSRCRTINQALRNDFNEGILQRANIFEWSQAARNAATQWSGWHWASYAAFCRNHGEYYTQAVGSRCWNAEMIETMANDLDRPWQVLLESVQSHQEDLLSSVQESIDWAIQYLETEIQRSSELVDTLTEALASRLGHLSDELEDIYDKLESDLSTLKIDSLSGIQTSYIGQAMKETYDHCNMECGTGSHARRKAIMNRRVRDQELLKTVIKETRIQFKSLADGFQSSVQSAVRIQFDGLQETLDIFREENAASESEQDPDFHGRIEEVVGTCREALTRIQVQVSGVAN